MRCKVSKCSVEWVYQGRMVTRRKLRVGKALLKKVYRLCEGTGVTAIVCMNNGTKVER
jgi:hypothetical protein